MRQDVLREIAGAGLIAVGAVGLGVVVVVLGIGGHWVLALLVGIAPCLVFSGVLLSRWDPVQRATSRALRDAARARAELHRTDPDAVIRER